MTTTGTTAGTSGRQARREVGRWIAKLARVGYLAKAVVYGLVGILALQLALGMKGGETTGSKGALHEILGAPWGKFLLAAVAVGLLFYAAWRLVQGVLDADGAGGDGKGLAQRAGYVGSGVIHVFMAWYAFLLVLGSGGGGGGGGGDQSEQAWTARLLAHERGAWLVALIGLIILVVGVYQLKHGWDGGFTRDWKTAEMSRRQREWGTRAGRVGLAARGVVFLVMGFFLLKAAWQHDATEARGLGGALAEVASAGYGTWLLGLVALGLLCHAVYCVVEARFRHFRVR